VGAEDKARLDPAALEALRELGGEEFVADLVQTFLDDAPPLLAALRGSDAGEVRRAAHTLKSNGTTFGATQLAELCRELEGLAKADELDGAPALADRIDAEYALVAEELGR
jgi:HPt (histidine-containing phosphotransfer) domain-containing protein